MMVKKQIIAKKIIPTLEMFSIPRLVLYIKIIPKNKIKEDKKLNIYLFIFYTLAFIFMFIAIFLTLGSLGIYLCDLYQYPEYTVLKKITLFEFIDRIENFIYIKWILSTIMYLSIIIYYISYNVNKNSKKLVPTILVAITIAISLFIFKNNTIFYNFTSTLYPYIGLFLLIIFIIISINIFVRKLLFE